MPDKSPHRQDMKKSAAKSIKQKRAEKRAKGTPGAPIDPVAHIKKR